jgi:hypothetical protein
MTKKLNTTQSQSRKSAELKETKPEERPFVLEKLRSETEKKWITLVQNALDRWTAYLQGLFPRV